MDDTFSGVHDESINEFVIKAESHRHSLSGHPFLMSNDVNRLHAFYILPHFQSARMEVAPAGKAIQADDADVKL